MPESAPLTIENDGAVRVVTLSRPETRNALNRALVSALGAALSDAANDAGVRAIVLQGSGGSFCAGADLKSAFVDDPDLADRLEERVDEFHAMIRAITRAPKPVIAAVDGAAVGFGCDLALACDLRLASSTAYFQEKFVKIGLMPDGGGTFFLPRLVGTARALELMMTGAPVHAAEALALGIVSRVVAPEKLASEARALATELAKGPPIALAELKRATLASLGGTLDDALAREKAGQVRCLKSSDAMEGVAAWMQRREPDFRGS